MLDADFNKLLEVRKISQITSTRGDSITLYQGFSAERAESVIVLATKIYHTRYDEVTKNSAWVGSFRKTAEEFITHLRDNGYDDFIAAEFFGDAYLNLSLNKCPGAFLVVQKINGFYDYLPMVFGSISQAESYIKKNGVEGRQYWVSK